MGWEGNAVVHLFYFKVSVPYLLENNYAFGNAPYIT